MANNKNTTKKGFALLKSKGFVFTLLTIILILSTFTIFLMDKENSYRPKELNVKFFIDLLTIFGIEPFNVGLTSWALFLIVFGVAYITFIAIFFYKSARTKSDAKSYVKYGHELQGIQLFNFNLLYFLFIAVLLGGLAVFAIFWFPWNEVHWETISVENLINFAEALAIIVSIIIIIPAALAIIVLALKGLIAIITIIASAISRGVVQSQGYQEALVATQVATQQIAIDAQKNLERARQALGATRDAQAGGHSGATSYTIFPSLTNIDINWAKVDADEQKQFEEACKEAEKREQPAPTRTTRDDIKNELSKYAASAADQLVQVVEEEKPVEQPTPEVAPEPVAVEKGGKNKKGKKPAKAKKAKKVNKKIDPKTDPKNNLKDFAPRFQAYLANRKNLYFDLPTLRSFVAGMSAARLILLEGLSGTGKSTLPREFLDFVGGKAHFFPVQATWKDRTDIVGYYSDLIGEFKETQLLENLYEASYTPNDFNVMVLDEMNISRVEYYFADFLSVFEYPSKDWLVRLINTKPGEVLPKFIENGMVRIPTNTWFIGTINIDDSTFTVTDKVYDRSIVIDFKELSKPFKSKENDEPYPLTVLELYKAFNYVQTTEEYKLSPKEKNKFLKLCDVTTETFDIRFGNRIMNQVERFLPVYVALGGTKEEALDIMFANKILRKIEGRFENYINDGLIKLQKYINTAYGKKAFKETTYAISKYRRKFN